MRSIGKAFIAVTLVASASTPTLAQRPYGDGDSGDRYALQALASFQVVHSAFLVGRVSPAYADWICVVHQPNPSKSDKSQDWKIPYLINCSANTTAFVARGGHSDGDRVFKFLDASGSSVPGSVGSSSSAEGVVGGSSGGNSNGAAASGNTAVVTQTITNPEPSTIVLVSSGLAMLGASAIRRRRS
jgi:hypothetical protein